MAHAAAPPSTTAITIAMTAKRSEVPTDAQGSGTGVEAGADTAARGQVPPGVEAELAVRSGGERASDEARERHEHHRHERHRGRAGRAAVAAASAACSPHHRAGG